MAIVINGKNLVRDLIASGGTTPVSQAGMGTVITAPTEADTGLNSNSNLGIADTISTSVEKSDKQCTFSYTLPSTEGTGITFREFGLSAAGTAVLFNRQVFYDLAHTSNDEITITQIISIK